MKNDQLIIDGKIYFSTRRGAEIAGYSADYVGQLCRAHKVDCRMVGRSWYVEKGSILAHSEAAFKANHTSFKAKDFLVSASNSLSAPSEMLLASPGGHISSSILSQAINPPYQGTSSSNSDLYSTKSRSKYSWFLFVTTVIVLIIFIFSSPRLFVLNNTSNTANVSSAIDDFGNSIKSSISYGYNFLISKIFLSGTQDVVKSNISDVQDPNQSLPYSGLVVVPSQGSTSTDLKLANTITNSFSDPVQVHETPGSNSGTITPEFRTVNGHDYLYVLVPVKTASSTNAEGTTTNMSQQ